MTVSPVSISSNALVLLGGSPIAALDEDSTGSQIAALLYETSYHSLLTATRWRFASRNVKLARHIEEPKDSPWKYKFQLPVDSLYVTTCSDLNYEIYERDLYCNSKEVIIEYIYPPKEDNLPAYFVKALEFHLAGVFAIPLTCLLYTSPSPRDS